MGVHVIEAEACYKPCPYRPVLGLENLCIRVTVGDQNIDLRGGEQDLVNNCEDRI